MDATASAFVDWFKKHGTQSDAITLADFPGMGRGAIATRDIDPDTILFSIPRSLLLNTRYSKLSSLLEPEEWSSLQNWTALILVMLYESKQSDSLWREYFDITPTRFDSLMFWSAEELAELQGSTIVDKIGKEQAMEDYHKIVRPLVAARPDIFGDSAYYDEERYNRMGSLILSRSFHVEEAEAADEESDEGSDQAETSAMSLTSVKQDTSMGQASEDGGRANDEDVDGIDSDDEDDEESVQHIAMVPWADMLNARHGCDNARLFYEKNCLNMVSTKSIAKGEQIWNVYGDPPNSDLLRRYGHVDAHNPSDIVEITADLVADVVCKDNREERIEFLLEADIDDTYVLTLEDHEEEFEQLLCAIAVFHADQAAFTKMQAKGKVSKKGLKADLNILRLARDILTKRLEQYPHSFEADEKTVTQSGGHQSRRLHATIVRHGEMRILRALIQEVEAKLPAPEPTTEDIKIGDTSMEVETPSDSRPQRILSKKEQREEKKRQREEDKLLGLTGDKKRRKA